MVCTVTVRDDTPRAYALEALWRCSKPADFYEVFGTPAMLEKQEAADWNGHKLVEEQIKSHPDIDYFGGRCIKVDFTHFPHLDLNAYQKQCGGPPISEIAERCFASVTGNVREMQQSFDAEQKTLWQRTKDAVKELLNPADTKYSNF